MRLLECKNDGEFSLTQFFDDIPRYAILSHTWGPEEVTFRDMMEGDGASRTGFDKIQFCGEQARRDGLRYFWVDTCCIDKSSSAELAEAINSMFRWYRDAAKCYVFLLDVPRADIDTTNQSQQLPWESALRTSRWFTRGWTLQELIAPTSVEFFSKNRKLLGDRKSLEQHICEITRIPSQALRGSPLAEFSATERMSWAETRQTTRGEDMAYSLLGIFDIYMPLIYGEGKDSALKRLREKIHKALKGTQSEDFSVAFSLSKVSEVNHFVAREEELAEIHKKLGSDGRRRTVVLHGLGGIGKTQLTIAYAILHKDSYSAVFWLNIKDEDSVKQSFARVAKQISRQHPLASQVSSVDAKGDLDEVVDAVKAWLSLPNNTRWLMIYDNYDNPKSPGNRDPAAVDIQKFLPESYQGSVIVTTRSSQVKIGHAIHIGKLEDVSDSLEILSSTSGREGLKHNPDAIGLAQELDGLPLALATAGAYLDQVTMSLSDYLRLYKESWAKLQKTSPELSSYEDRTLYSTWQISFEHVERRNVLSAQLLRLWAYFDNQDLWSELLQHSDSTDLDWLRGLVKDELSFHGAMRVLSDHGLIEVEKSSLELVESQGYSIHGCVHSWTVHVLNQEWNYDLARVAVKSVALHVPGEQANRPWLTQRRLLQHAARCSHIVLNGLVPDNNMAGAYFSLGYLFNKQGKLALAEQMYERALRGYETALGAEHTSTLDAVNNLGNLYRDQGKLALAEQMFERALRGYETALSAEHTSTLDAIHCLGILYQDQGKLALAEQMFERALRGYEMALGAEHTSTLNAVNNLGILYRGQGKLALAEQMYERALRGYETALGAEHTSTLLAVNNLGNLYRDQGKLALAEQMFERALRGRETALDAEHTSTLDAIHCLGILYLEQGKLALAEQMFERALRGYETALGAEHTSTLNAVNNLGNLYRDQGKLSLAEQMFERALRGYETALGADNITTYIPALNTLWGLGSLFKRQADFTKARIMYLKALVGYKKVFGPNHPTCQSLLEILQDLDTITEGEAIKGREELASDPQGNVSRLDSKGATLTLRRHKLFRKLGLR